MLFDAECLQISSISLFSSYVLNLENIKFSVQFKRSGTKMRTLGLKKMRTRGLKKMRFKKNANVLQLKFFGNTLFLTRKPLDIEY